MNYVIYPSARKSDTVVEPYNAVLASNALQEHSDVTVLMDNEALYNICSKQLDL